MALLIAGIAPLRWKGVSAWVPITNLATWHGENSDYAPHIAACVGENRVRTPKWIVNTANGRPFPSQRNCRPPLFLSTMAAMIP